MQDQRVLRNRKLKASATGLSLFIALMRALLALLLFAAPQPVLAQGTPNMGGGMVPNQPQLNIQGPITPGDCVVWVNANTIGDSGSPCGSGGGTPCTAGALDLSLTTGCNIPFYVGGVFP